jgi:hypothetical protein
MIDDITFNYHGGNPRSIEAHDRTKHRKAADYTRILNLLKDFPGGLICDRIEVALNMSHQTCSSRCSEMKKNGWLEVCGQGVTGTGSNADRLRIAPPQTKDGEP